jgi:hypothetical protein
LEKKIFFGPKRGRPKKKSFFKMGAPRGPFLFFIVKGEFWVFFLGKTTGKIGVGGILKFFPGKRAFPPRVPPGEKENFLK